MPLSSLFPRASMTLLASMMLLTSGFAADVHIGQLRVAKDQTITTYFNLKASETSLTEAEWRSALSGTDLVAANAILGRLNATRVTIERVEVETKQAGTTSHFVLKTLDMAQIVNGRAAAMGSGRGEMRTASGKDRDFMAFDGITARNVALAMPTKQDNGALPIVIAEASVDNIRTESGKNSAAAIKTLRIENMRGAMVDEKVLTVLNLITDRDFDQLSPLEKSAGAKAISEVYQNFSLGRVVAEDIAMRDGKERTLVKRVTLQGGDQSAFVIEGAEFRIGDETTRIGSFRMDDFSFEPTIKALLNMLGDATGKSEPPPADFMPRLGTISLSDMAVTGSKVAAYGGETTLKSFKLSFQNPLGGVPTGMRVSFDGLAAALDRNDPSAKELLSLGYQRIDAGGAIDIDVDKARDILAIREMSLRIKDMGTLHLTGSIANIAEIMAAKDSDEAALAALSLNLKTLGIGVSNEGLFERVLKKTATETGKTPDQVKREITSLAALGLPGLLGDSPHAKAIVNASTRFLARPERIVFAFKAKSPDGIGIADMMGIGTPNDFFALTDLSIQAGP
jgi:hypothetical protein